MSDKFVQPIAQSNYELVPLPGAFITDGRFVRYENDKNISDTVKDFDGKISSASEAAEEASDKADALDTRVTALENKPSGDDYSPLKNKPKINGVELSGNKTAEDLGLGTYSKPSGGIPKTDLTSDVQTSLGKADTALQEHQDISGKIDAPQTAEVGQVLAVKAVDASGRPIEWETVEKGGGGGGGTNIFTKTVQLKVRKNNTVSLTDAYEIPAHKIVVAFYTRSWYIQDGNTYDISYTYIYDADTTREKNALFGIANTSDEPITMQVGARIYGRDYAPEFDTFIDLVIFEYDI